MPVNRASYVNQLPVPGFMGFFCSLPAVARPHREKLTDRPSLKSTHDVSVSSRVQFLSRLTMFGGRKLKKTIIQQPSSGAESSFWPAQSMLFSTAVHSSDSKALLEVLPTREHMVWTADAAAGRCFQGVRLSSIDLGRIPSKETTPCCFVQQWCHT